MIERVQAKKVKVDADLTSESIAPSNRRDLRATKTLLEERAIEAEQLEFTEQETKDFLAQFDLDSDGKVHKASFIAKATSIIIQTILAGSSSRAD